MMCTTKPEERSSALLAGADSSTAFQGGSRLGRAFKALLLGSIAAAVGAVIYYAITQITGLNLALVAVVVGLMVGGAVKAGSGHRGGRFYQLLAVLLTYTAIAAMYLPATVELMSEWFREAAEADLIQRKETVPPSQ